MNSAEDLVRAVRAAMAGGAPTAGLKEQLWAACLDVVAPLASRYTRNAPDLREDFLSEGYLKFEQVLASFDPNRGVPFRGYLSRCIERHFHDRVRKKQERPTDQPPERAIEPAPLAALARQERDRHVREALAEVLPTDGARGRKVRAFELRHFEGWSLEEIREALGAPTTNTIAQWVHRVRKALRQHLRQRDDYDADERTGARPHNARSSSSN